jgi:hypothetical protein
MRFSERRSTLCFEDASILAGNHSNKVLRDRARGPATELEVIATESIAIAITLQYALDRCSKQPKIASNAKAISDAFKTCHSVQLLDSGDKNQ